MKKVFKKNLRGLIPTLCVSVVLIIAGIISFESCDSDELNVNEDLIYDKYLDADIKNIGNMSDAEYVNLEEAYYRMHAVTIVVNDRLELKKGINAKKMNISERLFDYLIQAKSSINQKIDKGELVIIDGLVYDPNIYTNLSQNMTKTRNNGLPWDFEIVTTSSSPGNYTQTMIQSLYLISTETNFTQSGAQQYCYDYGTATAQFSATLGVIALVNLKNPVGAPAGALIALIDLTVTLVGLDSANKIKAAADKGPITVKELIPVGVPNAIKTSTVYDYKGDIICRIVGF